MKLFPEVTLSATEMDIIAQCVSNPSVQKYLQYQIYQAAASVAMGEPAVGESPESYLRRAAEIRGMIKFASALLAIETAEQAAATNVQQQ